MSASNGQNDRQIESVKKEHIKKDTHVKQTNAFLSVGAATMNRDPAKMAWTDFSHVADFFPDPPRTSEALNRVLFDIGRLLRIRQEKLMRGLQKAGAGRLLLILDYLLGKGEAIRQPEGVLQRVTPDLCDPLGPVKPGPDHPFGIAVLGDLHAPKTTGHIAAKQ